MGAKGTEKDPNDGLKAFCRSLPGVTEDVKWADNHVFSVGGKMFALFDMDDQELYSFKCDDEDFDELTERDGLIPAPYAARFGWVKIDRPGALTNAQAKRLIRKSHALVASKLTRKLRRELGLSD